MAEPAQTRAYMTIHDPKSWMFVDFTLDSLADLHPSLQVHPLIGSQRGRDRREDETIWVLSKVFPFMLKCHFLGEALAKVSKEHQVHILNHLAAEFQESLMAAVACGDWQHSSFDEQRSSKLVEKAVSTVYECIVAGRLYEAGFVPEFIPESARPTPDLKIVAANMLIECKDLKTESLAAGKRQSLSLALRDVLDDALKKFEAEDPRHEQSWVTFVDMPDAPGSAWEALGRHGDLDLIAEALFDVDQPAGIAHRYWSTIMSCHECHSHSDGGDLEQMHILPYFRASWRHPVGPPMNEPNLARFYNRFFRGMRSVPVKHLRAR